MWDKFALNLVLIEHQYAGNALSGGATWNEFSGQH